MEEQNNLGNEIDSGFEELKLEDITNNDSDTNQEDFYEALSPEEQIVKQHQQKNSWTSFVANQLGYEDGEIFVGDPDDPYKEPVRKNINDLTDRELQSLLAYHNSQQGLSEEEVEFLDLVRNGQFETLREQLDEALGYEREFNAQMIPLSLDEEQLLEWKVRSEFPSFTDEQIADEIEIFKQSSSYYDKLENVRQQYENFAQQYNEQVKQYEKRYLQQEILQNQNAIEEALYGADDILGFELDDEIRQDVISDLMEFGEDGLTPFIRFIDQPEGMVTAAATLRMLPKIAELVDYLKTELDDVKSRKVNYIQEDPWQQKANQTINQLDKLLGQMETFGSLE